jgi:hypothetical protein
MTINALTTRISRLESDVRAAYAAKNPYEVQLVLCAMFDSMHLPCSRLEGALPCLSEEHMQSEEFLRGSQVRTPPDWLKLMMDASASLKGYRLEAGDPQPCDAEKALDDALNAHASYFIPIGSDENRWVVRP